MAYIMRLPWHVPLGAFTLRVDSLSFMFLIAVIVLSVCAGFYGIGYMRVYRAPKTLYFHSFFYLVLTFSILLLVTANNILLFLAAWEMMSISTYFLIVFHDDKPSVRKAGFLYFMMAHCGTFLLLIMFFLMAHTSGSMDFDVIARTSFSPTLVGIIFILALVGFGVKAGILPLHIWLPHAHPVAPAHISALLSGVGIKVGIYGICRVLWMVGDFPAWCGYVLLTVGIISGVMGVLYALGQHEIKRLLAYHSIENIGIIALGLGVGLIGRSQHMPFIAALGFAGALLHVVNHALFKGLLFLCAGSVIQKTHTGELDHLGGLSKIMPKTAVLFLIGSLSICGLPLFNGFVSEFIVYFGLFQGVMGMTLAGVVCCAFGILSLALIGTLALACFTKVYGTVFLGKPRVFLKEMGPQDHQEMPRFMFFPMVILAGLCVWIGLAPSVMVRFSFAGGGFMAHIDKTTFFLERVMAPFYAIIGSVFLLAALMLVLIIARRVLLRSCLAPVSETWGCAFSLPSPRFQYTSSSFARSIVTCFQKVLLVHRRGGPLLDFFPSKSHRSSSVHDASEERLFKPLLSFLFRAANKIDEKKMRYTQAYLFYIFLFLVFLLVWKMR